MKTSLIDKIVTISLIYEVLRSYAANLMKLSPLFMEIWPWKYGLYETIHCLNVNTKRQKRHDVTYDFLICGFVGCMKNMLILANIMFYYPLHVCNGIRRKVDTDSFLPRICMI